MEHEEFKKFSAEVKADLEKEYFLISRAQAKVIGAVAAILGISNVATALKVAQDTLKTPEVAKIMEGLHEGERAATNLVTLNNTYKVQFKNEGGTMRFGDLQVCWGTQDRGTSPNTLKREFTVSFPTAFARPPVLTLGKTQVIDNSVSDTRFFDFGNIHTEVHESNFISNWAASTTNDDRAGAEKMHLTLSYVAVGPWR